MEQRSDKIKESIAYKRMEKSGLISRSTPNGTHKVLLNIGEVIREMGSFAGDLEALIDKELRSSIEKIEKYSIVTT